MDDDLGLSERERELRRWNVPYVYREFPKMLFRGMTTPLGRVEYESCVVASVNEEDAALASGWHLDPQDALSHEQARVAALGTAAAERAWADRRLSAAAQAEAAGMDASTLRHLPDLPEAPRRSHTRKAPSDG